MPMRRLPSPWPARPSSVAALTPCSPLSVRSDANRSCRRRTTPDSKFSQRAPGDPSLRIEVKPRIVGTDTFAITRNEVLLALNAAPHHRLALVSVHPDGPHLDQVRYIGDLFAGAEPSWINDFGVVSQTLSWDHHWDAGRIPF